MDAFVEAYGPLSSDLLPNRSKHNGMRHFFVVQIQHDERGSEQVFVQLLRARSLDQLALQIEPELQAQIDATPQNQPRPFAMPLLADRFMLGDGPLYKITELTGNGLVVPSGLPRAFEPDNTQEQ